MHHNCPLFAYRESKQETQLSLTNRATRLEVNQGQQTIRYVRYGFLLVWFNYLVPKTDCFLRYSTCKYTVILKPGYGSLKVIGTDTDRSATFDFLLTFHSNHGPIS